MKQVLIRNINKLSRFMVYHKADISLAVGAVAGVITVISASKQTLNMPDILDEAKSEIEEVKKEAENNPTVNKGKELTKIYAKTAVKTVGNYIPTVLWGTATVGLIGTSFRILRKENEELKVKLNTVVAVANEAYQRVKNKYGEEEAVRLWSGAEEKTATVISTDENGKESKKKEKINVLKKDDYPDSNDPFTIIFDEANAPHTFDSHYKGANLIFLRHVLTECNNLYKRKGRIYVNEIRQMLGVREIEDGWDYGKSKKLHPNDDLDDCVDFGLLEFYDGDSYFTKQSFMRGDITGIILHLNIDGYIRGKVDYDYGF